MTIPKLTGLTIIYYFSQFCGLSWGWRPQDCLTPKSGALVLAVAWCNSLLGLSLTLGLLARGSSSLSFACWLAGFQGRCHEPLKAWTGIGTVSLLVQSWGQNKSQGQRNSTGGETDSASCWVEQQSLRWKGLAAIFADDPPCCVCVCINI